MSDGHVDLEEPPVFYCWKYWMSNGEAREGCTPLAPKESWPDLNDYGWVYMVIPLAVMFLIILLSYCICSSRESKRVPKKPLIEDSESEDEIDSVPKRSRNAQPPHMMHVVPVRKSTNSFYETVRLVSPQNPAGPTQKVPLQGGVSAPVASNKTQQAANPQLYPHLSVNKPSNAFKSVNENLRANGNKRGATNDYVNSTAGSNYGGRRNAPKRTEEETVASEDDYTDTQTESEDENPKK